jgi:hypothetical protein
VKENRFPYHLLAAAAFPLLFLFSNNLEYVLLVDLIRPLVISLLLLFALWGILSLILKSAQRAAVLASLLWVAFSVYGHLYQIFRGAPSLANTLGRHSILGPVFLVLVALMVWLVVRSKHIQTITLFLNAILGILVLLMLINVGLGSWNESRSRKGTISATSREPVSLPAVTGDLPDIYYIILDTYSRADVIRDKIGLDTSPFLKALEQKGFYVAKDAHSNYDSTRVSLTSSLNLDFIPNLDPRFVPNNGNNAIMDDYILHSKVRSTLEKLGYRTEAFATGFSFTEITDANPYLSPPRPSLLKPNVQPFESLWLKTTGLRALFDTHPAFLSSVLNQLSFPFQSHVERQEFLLDQLTKLPETPGPKFVFAHVIIPHVPMVFRADGSVTRDDRYFRETFDQPSSEEYLINGYRNQVQFINNRLLEIVNVIQKKSKTPPVIILQGDHGLLYYNHFPILSAYYFPDTCKKNLYPGITPVNSFRTLFNACFGADLPLLPDQSYTSTYTKPYDFKAVEVAPAGQ